MDWKKVARAAQLEVKPYIDGRAIDSISREFADNINPADETVLCRMPIGHPADVDEAVRVARRRFDDGCWSDLSPRRRATMLQNLSDIVHDRKSEIAILDTLEMGKPIRAALQDAERCAKTLRYWAGLADGLLGESSQIQGGTISFNVFEPRGVVGAITPWNFPSVNAVTKVAPALIAGNTVVLKPSEIAPSSAIRLAAMAVEADIPSGVLNVVPGMGRSVGAALASHSEVDFLSFTGSTETGRRIMELAGRSNGKPLLLECGGKSPQVVFDDVDDLDRVAEEIVSGFLRNQGQVCSAHTRLLVQVGIKDSLVGKVVARARLFTPSNPLDESTTFGPLASPGQRDRVKKYVNDGLRSGAVALLSGRIQESEGCYVSPTIFDCVNSSMSIVRDEIFGPVLCVQAFHTDEEAISLANDTSYGLVATVWTRDMGRAKKLAQAIRAGHLWIRTAGHEGPDSGGLMSFEPKKASGFGVEIGLKGLQSYAILKSVSICGE